MTNNECRNCSGRAEMFLCWNCAKQLRRALIGDPHGSTPGCCWYLARLEETAYGGATMGTHDGPRAPVDTRSVPYGDRAAKVRAKFLADLARWVGELVGGSGGDGRIIPDLTVWADFVGPLREGWSRLPTNYAISGADMAHYLARNLTALMSEPGSAAMLAGLKRMARQAEDVINRPPDEYCGPCPGTVDVDDDGVELACDADLYCLRDAPAVTCWRCRETHDPTAIRAQAVELADEQIRSGSDLFRLLALVGEMPVARSTFYKLLAKVTPRMYEHPDGQFNQRALTTSGGRAIALYAYGDVLAEVEAYAPPGKGEPEDGGAKRTRKRAKRVAA